MSHFDLPEVFTVTLRLYDAGEVQILENQAAFRPEREYIDRNFTDC